MVQPTNRRFVLENRLISEIATLNGTIDGDEVLIQNNADAIVVTNAAVATINANAARGTGTQYVVTNLAALDAVSTAVIGDLAYMTAPGTGIQSLKWEAFAGSGSTIDWHIVDTVRADTLANLDAFIAAVAALIGDLSFVIGGLAYVSGTQVAYSFTTTAGVKQPLSALVPIVPTSITASTGTSSLSANGLVTFSGVTAAGAGIGINGCFTSAFDNYLVIVDIPTATAGALICTLRLAGANVVTANYDSINAYGTSAAAAASGQLLAQTSWFLSGIATVTGTSHNVEAKFFAPALAAPTRVVAQSITTTNPMTAALTGGSVNSKALLHRLSTAYDGFALQSNTGNITGTVRIYGYANLT